MFDRPTDAAPRPDRTETNLERLCAAYDGLLATAPATLTPAAAAELNAMAGVFDIDADRAPAEVWGDVRAALLAQPKGAEAPPAPLTVLVVEDDADTAADLVETLVEAGHDVVGPFPDVATAEAALATHAVDVALLDIKLAGPESGADLARSIRGKWDARLIFLSGNSAEATRSAHLADAIVLKPYTGAQVLSLLARFGRDQAPHG